MAKVARMLFLLVVVPLGLMLFLLHRGGFFQGWIEVRPADAHFTARFPVQPEASTKTVEAGRQRSTTWNSLKAKEAAVEYGIGWGTYPADRKLVASPQVFQNMEAAVAQECGGTVAEERALHRPLRSGMLEGRYLKIDAGQGWAEGYLFLSEGSPARVWQIMISYPKAGPEPPVQKYLNSFQVVDL
ncbi:MAG: hypothetical protein KF760_28345 [Candidatus Eremiobacteraeota bacterium]|nr:hypothetical protein [Candidatus Eremiobacteraeota bacterium]MCW5865807.1 hypothetical protein [Candidatus Eremiobacteraeota bacterium]